MKTIINEETLDKIRGIYRKAFDNKITFYEDHVIRFLRENGMDVMQIVAEGFEDVEFEDENDDVLRTHELLEGLLFEIQHWRQEWRDSQSYPRNVRVEKES